MKAEKPTSYPEIPADKCENIAISSKADSPKVAKRRKREIRVISQMVAMHCEGTHDKSLRTEIAECGDAVCKECAELDAYAVERTINCRNMDVKISCEECGNHCYSPKMRESIREAMRWSGPRMIFEHPIEAVRHLLGK